MDNKSKKELISKAFTKKEQTTIRKESQKTRHKRKRSRIARTDLREMLRGALPLDNETKIRRITEAFNKRDLHNKYPEDMTDTTISILLNKHTEDAVSSSSSNSTKSNKQLITEEAQIINTILEKYEAEDKESPETETDSEVITNDLSGSEEEEIQYGDPSVNREDLPRVNFDYKNKEHVEKVLEAAQNGIF